MALGGAFSISGLVSGLKTDDIVTKLIDLQKTNLKSLQSRSKANDDRLAAVRTLSAQAEAFKVQSNLLKDPDTFAVTKATSADETVVKATAGTGAVPGKFKVEVENLAKAHQIYHAAGVADPDSATLGTGTITLGLGGATYAPITIDSSTNSLNKLAAKINAAGLNVIASVVNDGATATPYHLVLTSTQTGADNTITFTNNLAGGTVALPANQAAFGTLQSAEDAVIKIGESGALSITSASNKVTNAIPGVTLDLIKADDNVRYDVSVDSDTTAIRGYVDRFIAAYNRMADALSSATFADPDGKASGPLVSDATVLQVRGGVSDVVNNGVASLGDYKALADLGITLDTAGHLAVSDSTQLAEALSTNLDEVKDFFTNEDYGLAVQVSDYLDGLTESQIGALWLQDEFYATEQTTYADRIANEEDYLARQEADLREQFAAMEAALGKLQQQGQYLAAQFNAMNGNSQQNGSK